MKNVRFMTLTALLTAIAIFIPIAMPLKLVIPPASYTLGSHVAIFIAMFINPWIGHLRRSGVIVWILYFRGVPTRHRFPRAIAYSLCDTWSLFPTEISKDARKPQSVMDFQLRIGAHSRSRRSISLRALLLRFRNGSSKHVLRPLRPSRIWYSDSQYGRL